jgi:hypothetical protein
LELFVVLQIDDVSVIFQQDGASAHYANIFTEFLDIFTALYWEGRVEAMAPTLSGPDILGFLFHKVCEANRL